MRRVLPWIALIFSVCVTTAAAQAAPLHVDIEPGDADGVVKFSITNTSDVPVLVLRWDTPLERTISSDVFQLERQLKKWPLLQRAPYIGRDVKRAKPDADQYLILESGEKISREVVLNDYYQINEVGRWNVRFLGRIRHARLQVADQGTLARKAPEPPALNVETLESNSLVLSMVPGDSYRARTPAFNNCTAQQQADIVSATELAEEYAGTAVSDLQSVSVEQRATSPRYVTWFGAYDATRFGQVFSNFQTIGTVLESEEIRFDCGCNEAGVFAYVVPVRPYEIFLCPAFRAASIGGTDSRAGTIIHELTHFNVVAATDDHVYSQRGAQSLASTDPATAITNADSYEYFAENTPALNIRGTTADSIPSDFSVLVLNRPISGSVEAGSSVTYQVNNASQIILSSISGDADLYVYSDATQAAETCRSLNASADDVCENFVDGLIYVRVFGYTAATYTLEATGTNTDAPPTSLVTQLAPGTTAFGSLQEDERAVYQVNGVAQIELESLTGDADLYVFESLQFDDSTLVCSAAAYSADSTFDRCELPTPSATYYLLIIGFEASTYSLSAGDADPLPQDDESTTPAPSNSSPFTTVVSSSGGGGSSSWWGIGLFMLFNARCHAAGKKHQG